MKLKLIAVSVALALGAVSGAQAQTKADDSTRQARKTEENRIEAQAKAERQKCDPMKGNAKDICQAEAKGKEKVAKAELNARDDKEQARAQKKGADAKARPA